jgi:hypothetical protein
MALTVEEVEAVLRLRDELSGKLDAIKGNVSGFSDSLGKIAGIASSAFAFTEVLGASARVLTLTGTIDDLSKRVGISAEAVQELDFVAKQSGATFDEIARAITSMSRNLTAPTDGAIAALARINLNLDTLQQMTPDRAFQAIAAAIAQVADPMQRMQIATELFGRSGGALLAVLTSEIGKLREAARDAGAVMSDEMVAAGDRAGDSMTALQTKIDVLRATALLPLIDAFTALPSPVQTVLTLGQQLAPVIGAMGVAWLALGSHVTALIPSLLSAGSTLMSVATGATTASGALGLLGSALVTLGPSLAIMGTAIAGWKIGEWAANLKLFGDSAFSLGEAFEFSFTKALNWARGIQASDADIERAILLNREGATAVRAHGQAIEAMGPPWDGLTRTATTFAATLAAAKNEVTQLTSAQREEIRAALEMGIGHEQIAAAVHVSEVAVRLYRDELQRLTRQTQEQRERQQQFLASVSGAPRVWAPYAASVQDVGSALLQLQPLLSGTVQELAVAQAEARQWAEANGAILAPSIQQVSAVLETETPKWRSSLGGFFSELAQNTPQVMGKLQEQVSGRMTRLFGGGGVMQSVISTGLNAVFGPASGLISSLVTQGMAKAGEIVWAGLQKIGGFFRSLFGGPSADELAGREIVARFEANLATMLTEQQKLEAGNEAWKATVIAIRDAYLAQGLSEQEALADAERLWKSSQLGAAESARVVEDITRKMGEFSGQIGAAFSQIPSRIDVAIQGSWNIPPPPEIAGIDFGVGRLVGEFQSGGIVPRTGLALVHRGEQVIPAGGGGEIMGLGAVLAELQTMNRKLDRMPVWTRDAVLTAPR